VWAAEGGKYFIYRANDGMTWLSYDGLCVIGKAQGQVHNTATGRGLHSSTFQLNLSALYGRGGARRECVDRVKQVLGAFWGVSGVFL
jgi:hypothetical protein